MSLQNPKPSFTEIYFENLSCILLAAVVQQLLSKGSHSIRPDVRSSALDSVSPRSGIKSSNPCWFEKCGCYYLRQYDQRKIVQIQIQNVHLHIHSPNLWQVVSGQTALQSLELEQ